MRLKSTLGVGFLAMTIGRSALAADLPNWESPPPPPAPASFTWTGAYFGVDAGYSWASATGGYSISSATLSGLPPIIPTVDASGSQPLGLRGSLVGAELGYNWQASDLFVVGVEGDADWSGLSGSMTNGGAIPVVGGVYSIAQEFKTDWYGSLRGRVGLTPVDRLMIFATGGVAFTHINYASVFTDTFDENENVSIKAIKTGWVLGAGVEYALNANWSTKIEYLRSQFSASSGTGSGLLTDGTTATIAHSTGALGVNTVRVGLNYQFR
ncbi:outer membrane protein [Methylocapsa sp. S129]|uniref:outer membrane protein n=1 Tax=Methylocapsa sp. S129 TaxID=1641869 RepID=UPI00131D080C|nr:outer membrane protein [Methylocapsa sp. S129]